MAKRGPKPKGEPGFPHYEGGELEPVPRVHADFCERRVGFLATFHESHRPFKELLANAYWCGLQDTVEAYLRQGVEYRPEPPKLERDWLNLQPPGDPHAG